MKTLLLPPELTLSKEHWQLTLSPSAGGRITSLTSTHGGKAIDWIMPMPEECRQNGFPATAWPKAGIYPLLPFSNRIRNGKFFSERQEICLPLHPGEAHAMHGFGHTAEWQLLRCDGNSAEMLYDHKPGDNGWPWAFLAKQTVTLGTGALILTIEISNISNDVLPPMPLGVGFHPYFPRRFAKQIAFSAQQLWQIDAEHLAIGVGNTPAIHDYRSARPIAPDEELTLYYGGWNKLATMSDGNGY